MLLPDEAGFLDLEQDRKAHPEDFILTDKEIRYLNRVAPIIERIRAAYCVVDENGLGHERFDATTKAAAEEAFKNKKINPDTIGKLAKRILLQESWYTLDIAVFDGKECAYIRTHDTEKQGGEQRRGVILPEEWPEFYEKRTVWEQRRAIRLPVHLRYISSYGLYILEYAAIMLEVSDEVPTPKQEPRQINNTSLQKYKIATTKVSNELPDFIFGEQAAVRVSRARKPKKQVYVILETAQQDSGVSVSGMEHITALDRLVNDNIASLYMENESHTFTVAEIWRAVVADAKKATPSPQQLEDIEASIEKQRRTTIYINFKEHGELNHLDNSKSLIIDGSLLEARRARATKGGKKVTAYQFLKLPILHEYAAAVGQIATIPANMKDIKAIDEKTGAVSDAAAISNTTNNVLIKEFLLRRIEAMRGDNNFKPQPILLSKIYEYIGKPEPNRTESGRIRKDIEAMLKYWVAVKYIRSYKFVKDGAKIAKIAVFL